VKPGAFEYHAPRTVEDAVAILAQVAPLDGRVLAGGQTLVPAMALRLARPAHLVDINGVAGFDRLEVRDGALHIGPCVRHAALDASAAPGPLGRLLGLVQKHIAHYPIRARGTFCGSLANADAASEWCLTAIALEARIEALSERGARSIPAEEFLLGYMTTSLDADELLVQARLPLLADDVRVGFYEYARRAGDFAQVMALATYAVRDGVMAEPRIALGGLEPRSHRMREAEAALVGRAPDERAFQSAAAAAAAGLGPTEDPEYARALAEAAVLRALTAAV
jgi:carbon-monoxide dehydrogenase medium subunit